MAELRRDPITGRTVIIAPERAARPMEFGERRPTERSAASCPFCERSETETPGEIAALREPGTKPNEAGWQVRVVPNKFPALEPLGGDAAGVGAGRSEPDVVEGSAAVRGVVAAGVHEVIIEAPRHVVATGSLDVAQLTNVFKMYRERMLVHRADPRLRYVQIFKNVGEAAGASIEHLHSQLMGLEFVPQAIVDELKGCRNFHEQTGRCLFCGLVERELMTGERIVASTNDFVALCPYASRFPYEVWLLPRRHDARFEAAGDELLREAASSLSGVLRGIEKLLVASGLASVGYNYVLHSSPFDSMEPDYYHWHIEILPRAVKQAGFEWGTGVHINPVAPEEAAAVLRELAGATPA